MASELKEVRYEAVASDPTAVWRIATVANYKADMVQQQRGDFQKLFNRLKESMNRVEALLQRLVSQAQTFDQTVGRGEPYSRLSEESRNLPVRIQPREMEMARSAEDLWQSSQKGTQGIQAMSTPEGNINFPSPGLSVVVTGWGEDPWPCSSLASSTWDHQNPSHEPTSVKQWNSNPSKEKVFSAPTVNADLDWSIEDKQVRHFTGFGNTPMVYLLKPVIEEIQKSAEDSGDRRIAKMCLGMLKATRSHLENKNVAYRKGIGVVCNKKGGFGVDDRWLWSTGLLWNLPPWPDLSLCEANWMAIDWVDFCTMNCDRFAQHCEYEVIEKFYSVKQYSHSVLDYTYKFEELVKIWPFVNEERKMLQMAGVWREERVQIKLVDAKLTLDSKYAQLNKLQSDIEDFLSFHRGNSVDKESVRDAERLREVICSMKSQEMKEFSHKPPPPTDDFFAVFEELRQREGTNEKEIGQRKGAPPSIKLWVKRDLPTQHILLRKRIVVSRQWDHKVPVDVFYLTLRISQDDFPQYEEFKHILIEVVQICQQDKMRQLSVQADMNLLTAYPEYIISYSVHVLTHDPACPNIEEYEDVKTLGPIYWRLHLFLSSLLGEEGLQHRVPGMEKESFTTIVSIFRSVKCSKDVVDLNKTKTLHAICDLGILITKRLCQDHINVSETQMVPLSTQLYGQNENSVESNEQMWLGCEDVLDSTWTSRYESSDYVVIAGEQWFLKTAVYKENGTVEFNRGPRSGHFKNQKLFGHSITIALKGQSLPSNENKNASAVPDRAQCNREDFPVQYNDAKFFFIKSYSEDDVYKSVKYNVWASIPNGNKKLDAGYREVQEKLSECPVFLLFSVNTSDRFVGVSEMVGPVDFDKTVDYWQQNKWNGCFPVKWHIVKDEPNNILKHITLDNKDNYHCSWWKRQVAQSSCTAYNFAPLLTEWVTTSGAVSPETALTASEECGKMLRMGDRPGRHGFVRKKLLPYAIICGCRRQIDRLLKDLPTLFNTIEDFLWFKLSALREYASASSSDVLNEGLLPHTLEDLQNYLNKFEPPSYTKSVKDPLVCPYVLLLSIQSLPAILYLSKEVGEEGYHVDAVHISIALADHGVLPDGVGSGQKMGVMDACAEASSIIRQYGSIHLRNGNLDLALEYYAQAAAALGGGEKTILEGKYAAKGGGLSEPGILKELKKALKKKEV